MSPASTASERVTLEPITSLEDAALVVAMNAAIPELFFKPLAGSYRDETIRCIMHIAETFPERPAGMHDIARGQCRSLPEDPKRRRHIDMPTAKAEPRAFRPMEIVYEDELGDAIPIAHALFLPLDGALPRAPYLVVGESVLPDAAT